MAIALTNSSSEQSIPSDLFNCSACGCTHDAEEWDKKTLAMGVNRKKKRSFKSIAKLASVNRWYMCPHCEKVGQLGKDIKRVGTAIETTKRGAEDNI